MPLYRPPWKYGAHRSQVIGIYRALLSKCNKIPISSTEQTSLRRLIQKRFRQDRRVQSRRLLNIGFQACNEAISLFQAAINNDEPSLAKITNLLNQVPNAFKILYPVSPSSRVPPPAEKKPLKRRERQPNPSDQQASTFTSAIFRRPYAKVSGRRRVPSLVNASGFPYLRTCKPETNHVNQVLLQKAKTTQRMFDRKARLDVNQFMGDCEDEWDNIVERSYAAGNAAKLQEEHKNLSEQSGESSWKEAPKQALVDWSKWMTTSREHSIERARRYWEIVQAEKKLVEEERREKLRARRRRLRARKRALLQEY